MTKNILTGRCLCGGIEFSIEKAAITHANVCHCSQCRRWSGHQWASADAPLEALKITKGEELVKWHRASDFARRGFCCDCGSALFWHADGLEEYKDRISVAMGALDAPTGITLDAHIFVADKGDYYDIADGLPQRTD